MEDNETGDITRMIRRTIYKFPLAIEEKQKIEFLKEAGTTCKIIHVGLDPQDQPCVWIELYVGTYPCSYEFKIIGTGGRVSGCDNHVGSFVQGRYVWHVYVLESGRRDSSPQLRVLARLLHL